METYNGITQERRNKWERLQRHEYGRGRLDRGIAYGLTYGDWFRLVFMLVSAWVSLLEPHGYWLNMQRELPQGKKGTTTFVIQDEMRL